MATFEIKVKHLIDPKKAVAAYKREFKKKLKKLMDLLGREGVQIAGAYLQEFLAIDTGELYDAITYYVYADGKHAVIRTGSDHAAFVEFGTGVKGANSPHPSMPWDYDIRGHGYKGWYYPTKASDPNPYKYRSKKTGQWWGWTRGMPSRPFMYYTAQDLSRDVPDRAREVFFET